MCVSGGYAKQSTGVANAQAKLALERSYGRGKVLLSCKLSSYEIAAFLEKVGDSSIEAERQTENLFDVKSFWILSNELHSVSEATAGLVERATVSLYAWNLGRRCDPFPTAASNVENDLLLRGDLCMRHDSSQVNGVNARFQSTLLGRQRHHT